MDTLTWWQEEWGNRICFFLIFIQDPSPPFLIWVCKHTWTCRRLWLCVHTWTAGCVCLHSLQVRPSFLPSQGLLVRLTAKDFLRLPLGMWQPFSDRFPRRCAQTMRIAFIKKEKTTTTKPKHVSPTSSRGFSSWASFLTSFAELQKHEMRNGQRCFPKQRNCEIWKHFLLSDVLQIKSLFFLFEHLYIKKGTLHMNGGHKNMQKCQSVASLHLHPSSYMSK